MNGYSISEVAARTGFAASTLRFYEQQGLLRPGRSPSGYRCYGEDDLELLAFIRRAKTLGLSLEEITEVSLLLADEHCRPVQERLRALVAEKLAETRARIAELSAFAADLESVQVQLADPPVDGPCDERCACAIDAACTPGTVRTVAAPS